MTHAQPGKAPVCSLWAKEKLPAFAPLEGDEKTDVLIIGGGMAGLLTAHVLTHAGINNMLIEADTICSGVTGRTTAKITSQHGLIYTRLLDTFGAETARMYYQANEDALAQYRALSSDIPCDFEEKDAYIYSADHPERIEQELRTLSRLGIPAEHAASLPLPFPVAAAVRFTRQAQFHPLKFAAGIAKGLNIKEHTAALGFKGNTVLTNRGTIRADVIVIATHFPIINKHGGYFLKLYQDRSYVLALRDAPDVDGMYLDEAQGGLSLRNAGGALLLGGVAHRTCKKSSGWADLEAFAKAHYPKAQAQYRWATQDCMTLDGVPYIGRYGAHTQNLFVATGFGKWGMTSSMAAATLLCDLIQGKQNAYAGLFSPSRSMLRTQLAANALEATASLLTPTKPRCPHMGCALKWNAQERSWDCPCHGSRFSESGKLLSNPSTGNLK